MFLFVHIHIVLDNCSGIPKAGHGWPMALSFAFYELPSTRHVFLPVLPASAWHRGWKCVPAHNVKM
eukprot:365479-Chlamydomonas_euryale.AAC.9